MNIGNNLRRYRRERDMTQEDLANVLGVSFQSVSKWERGDGYPDITLLPVIARFFKVSVDELLGMDEEHMWEEISEVQREYWRRRNADTAEYEAGSAAALDHGSAAYRDALKKYPNNLYLMREFARSLDGYRGEEQLSPGCLEEAVGVYERILAYFTDIDTQIETRSELAYAYFRLGQRERAVEETQKLPSDTRAYKMALITRGEEQIRNIQSYLAQCLYEVFAITRFAAPRDTYVFDVDDDVFGYTNAERIRILQIGVNALELLIDEGDTVPVLPMRVGYYYRSMAELSLMDGEVERALNYLEKAADYAIINDTGRFSGGAPTTSVLRNRCGAVPIGDGYTATADLYGRLVGFGEDSGEETRAREWGLLKPISEHARYRAIVARVEPYAKAVIAENDALRKSLNE
ncbi:MAG: helix-turn-helix domain-containing protein [Oscillospiraceae bacterium]|jgi:transcriptional regulator with XRE-family HTH domain|nr:helix-turn-helix domain-containing protein [Oscillospiraceae bacterium]